MIGPLIRWIISDLRVASQLNLEDAELLRHGYTWSETQRMTMLERQEKLNASAIVEDFRMMTDRRSKIDVAVMTSGFADAKARRSISARWDADADNHMGRLSEYNFESGVSIRVRSKPTIKKRNFKETLLAAKNGKVQNR